MPSRKRLHFGHISVSPIQNNNLYNLALTLYQSPELILCLKNFYKHKKNYLTENIVDNINDACKKCMAMTYNSKYICPPLHILHVYTVYRLADLHQCILDIACFFLFEFASMDFASSSTIADCRGYSPMLVPAS